MFPTLVSASLLLFSLLGSVRSQDRSASCNILAGSGSGSVAGTIQLSQPFSGGNVTLTLNLNSLPPSGLHGFHVHANASLGGNCTWAAGHLNVDNTMHGAPTDPQNKRHTGDLGNIMADASGNTVVTISDWLISLDPSSPNYIMGKPIVVHALEDDLGRGNSSVSNTTGNAGARLGCCLIAPSGPSVDLPGTTPTFGAGPTTTPLSTVVTGVPTTTTPPKITTTSKAFTVTVSITLILLVTVLALIIPSSLN